MGKEMTQQIGDPDTLIKTKVSNSSNDRNGKQEKQKEMDKEKTQHSDKDMLY